MNLYNINNDAKIAASDIIAGKDINISGRNVEITAKDESDDYKYSYEKKTSGLTMSIGGGLVGSALNTVDKRRRSNGIGNSPAYRAVQPLDPCTTGKIKGCTGQSGN